MKNRHRTSLRRLNRSALLLFFISFILFAGHTGCAVISVKPTKGTKVDRPADYEETLPFYFFGLIGKNHLNVRQICFGREVELIRNEYLPEDISWAIKSLLIYTPKTTRIWCKEPF